MIRILNKLKPIFESKDCKLSMKLNRYSVEISLTRVVNGKERSIDRIFLKEEFSTELLITDRIMAMYKQLESRNEE